MAAQDAYFERVAIVGVGLLGGSLGLALKARSLAGERLGIGRNAERLETARAAGVIDAVSTRLEDCATADLIVLCGPVSLIAGQIPTVFNIAKAGALITDVGSTKRQLVDVANAQRREGVHFVGSHPMAGSEKQGFEHGSAELFQDACCVLTPDLGTDDRALARVRAFWQALGMEVLELLPARHDAVLAMLSHLPHLVAGVLVEQARRGSRNAEDVLTRVAGPGFRDSTRIAMGGADIWMDILASNRGAISESIAATRDILLELQRALDSGNDDALRSFLERNAKLRMKFERQQPDPDRK